MNNPILVFLLVSAVCLQNVTMDGGLKQILFVIIFIVGAIVTFGSFLGLHL